MDDLTVTVYAALSGPMPKLGVIALAALVALALLHPVARVQVAAMVLASVLAPVLLVIDIWHSPQLAFVHRHPALAAGGAVVLGAVLIAFAFLLARRPRWVAVLVTAALPFRIPIQAGGKTSNLLVPLYFVVGAGVLALAIDALRGRGAEGSRRGADTARRSGACADRARERRPSRAPGGARRSLGGAPAGPLRRALRGAGHVFIGL